MNLQELFNDHQLYHSEFQQDYLITARAGGTVYGQYKQSLRELYKRYRGLKQLYAEKALLQVDIDELSVSACDNVFEQRRNEIKKTQKIMSMEEMDKNIEDTEREFKRFYQQAVTLKRQIGDLTEEKRNRLDRDMWLFKLKEMAAIDFISQGRLGNVTVETIMSAPMDMRIEILRLINPQNQHKLIEWFECKNSDEIPLPKIDIGLDVKMLLKENLQ